MVSSLHVDQEYLFNQVQQQYSLVCIRDNHAHSHKAHHIQVNSNNVYTRDRSYSRKAGAAPGGQERKQTHYSRRIVGLAMFAIRLAWESYAR